MTDEATGGKPLFCESVHPTQAAMDRMQDAGWMLLCERGELATDLATAHVTIPTAALTELRARVEKAEADAAQWKAVTDLSLMSWTKQSVRAWGHELTRESLTELIAAAEECGRDLDGHISDRWPYADRSPEPPIIRQTVRRLRAAVARVRGE